ncbi:hypothetical protein KSP39_PZI012837 [Platanthera zijinensis]|uniref:Uncharacterized protein n=1 Tax=Platanthera zijinensis TaxID=2320716 RepID=A0AAP0BE23_9ASPA
MKTSYDIENHSFQDSMFPFVKESVEVSIRRFIEQGFTKDKVKDVPFVKLFPEMESQVAAMERAAKGKESVEVAIGHFIDDGIAKEEVDKVPFLQLFPEQEEKVVDLERVVKGKAVNYE